MIRPVLYVDLPGILYALDRRARQLNRPFATFLCAPRYEETHSGLGAVLHTMLPVRTSAHTWICEEHWRMLGVAQARLRHDMTSWDLVYLASLDRHEAVSEGVLRALLEYVVNAALRSGLHRVFAEIDGRDETLEIFHPAGFQRYAQEHFYARETPQVLETGSDPLAPLGKEARFRRWHADDTWGLTQLYNAITPRRVQVAELLSSEELARQLVPRQRGWRLPLLEPRDETYVVDLGSHLAAWVRVRQSWAGIPHQLWLMVHPDHADLAPQAIRFALGRLCQHGIIPGTHPQRQPVICQIRGYAGATIDALRQAGFEHRDTKSILVRHLTLRAFSDNIGHKVKHAPVNYGIEGLGAVRSPTIHTRDVSACNTRSRITSTFSWPRSRRASRRESRATRTPPNS